MNTKYKAIVRALVLANLLLISSNVGYSEVSRRSSGEQRRESGGYSDSEERSSNNSFSDPTNDVLRTFSELSRLLDRDIPVPGSTADARAFGRFYRRQKLKVKQYRDQLEQLKAMIPNPSACIGEREVNDSAELSECKKLARKIERLEPQIEAFDDAYDAYSDYAENQTSDRLSDALDKGVGDKTDFNPLAGGGATTGPGGERISPIVSRVLQDIQTKYALEDEKRRLEEELIAEGIARRDEHGRLFAKTEAEASSFSSDPRKQLIDQISVNINPLEANILRFKANPQFAPQILRAEAERLRTQSATRREIRNAARKSAQADSAEKLRRATGTISFGPQISAIEKGKAITFGPEGKTPTYIELSGGCKVPLDEAARLLSEVKVHCNVDTFASDTPTSFRITTNSSYGVLATIKENLASQLNLENIRNAVKDNDFTVNPSDSKDQVEYDLGKWLAIVGNCQGENDETSKQSIYVETLSFARQPRCANFDANGKETSVEVSYLGLDDKTKTGNLSCQPQQGIKSGNKCRIENLHCEIVNKISSSDILPLDVEWVECPLDPIHGCSTMPCLINSSNWSDLAAEAAGSQTPVPTLQEPGAASGR
ncbi:MAG: hypothetical protein AB7F43_03360 [Bacteriovoracia bacterium]